MQRVQRAQVLGTAAGSARARLLPALQGRAGVVSAAHGANQLIQFKLDYVAFTILSISNQKYHEGGYDCRASVNDQWPGIAKAKYWPCNTTADQNDRSGG